MTRIPVTIWEEVTPGSAVIYSVDLNDLDIDVDILAPRAGQTIFIPSKITRHEMPIIREGNKAYILHVQRFEPHRIDDSIKDEHTFGSQNKYGQGAYNGIELKIGQGTSKVAQKSNFLRMVINRTLRHRID